MDDMIKIDEIFGCDVFNDTAMRKYLPGKVYEKLRETIDLGKELRSDIAEVVANGMKEWAISRGATHYTHWFQPLNGVTAEKHDSFVSAPGKHGGVLMEFSGKELIRGEPDASSFPSGGLRATFEARGYTVWDCTSPAFVRHDAAGATLCIPTAFCSYGGEALDKKTPLLRSMEVLDREALRIVRLFGNKEAKKVTAYVGPEQEYFLVDREKYLERKDLIYTGRTLFGARPPKGQELEDHYFGTIRERIGGFMKEVNEALWALGVPSKTQHNEVAPGQHELAVVYAQANVAVDHNQIIMETLKRVAGHHGLTCLLHEKPFAGVNGSGKHDNWSIVTDNGMNLLDPGKTPHENIQFLLVLSCILRAVDRHADLLRESAADVGNDDRLGGDEAPPSIISVFLGDQLEDVINQLRSTGSATYSKSGGTLTTSVRTLPDIYKDATDRNRTSPFAFTGNKFEFRMLGSRDSVSEPIIVLNSITAEAFREAADILEAAEDFDLAVHDLIKKYISEHSRIVFNGNGYSKEWEEEAKRRGLSNHKLMVDTIPALLQDETVAMYESLGVYTRKELQSRTEIAYEIYEKDLMIEARTMIDLVQKQIRPAVIHSETKLAKSILALREVSEELDTSVEERLLQEMTEELLRMDTCLKDLTEKVRALGSIQGSKERAVYCAYTIRRAMLDLRKPVDELEYLVGREDWPMPSYGDLLFEV